MWSNNDGMDPNWRPYPDPNDGYIKELQTQLASRDARIAGLERAIDGVRTGWEMAEADWERKKSELQARVKGLEAALRKLVGKSNVVTAEWRHHGTVEQTYSDSMGELYDMQVEAEKALSPKGGES